MSFIFLRTEAFKNNLPDKKTSPYSLVWNQSGRNSIGPQLVEKFSHPHIRRPLEGMEISERTPAYLSVLRADGTPILMSSTTGTIPESSVGNSPGDTGHGLKSRWYSDFMLLQVIESREEKMQILETFGAPYLFLFGERPRILACSGVLLNSIDFPWRSEFWKNYDAHLRGTRCVEQRAKAYLYFQDRVVEGYILKADAIDRADNPAQIPFNFTLLVTGYIDLVADSFSIFEDLSAARTFSNNGTRNELVGDLASEVRANGQFVDIGEGFWARQLRALAGGNLGQAVTAYVNAIAQDPSVIYRNPKALLPQHSINHLAKGGPIADALEEAPIPAPAPLRRLMVDRSREVMAMFGGEALSPGHGKVEKIASHGYARRVFGTSFKATHGLVRVP